MFRKAIIVDAVVVWCFIVQMAFFPEHFFVSSFGARSVGGVENDLRLLLLGIYVSWGVLLVAFSLDTKLHTPSAKFAFLISATLQLPIAIMLSNVTSMFRIVNYVMLIGWVIAYFFASR